MPVRPGCAGGPRPHDPAEDGFAGEVTAARGSGSHPLFVRFRGHGLATAPVGFHLFGRPYPPTSWS